MNGGFLYTNPYPMGDRGFGPVLGRDGAQTHKVGRTFWGSGKHMVRRGLAHLGEHPFMSRCTGSDEKEQPRLRGVQPERVGDAGRCETEPTFHEVGFAVAQDEGDLTGGDVEALILVIVAMQRSGESCGPLHFT